MGGDQRRAGGTAPGQLAAPRFRPRGQDDLAPSGSVARIRANLAALATLRAIEREDRPAAPDEQAALARWSGWGAVPEVFDEGKPEYAWAREELSRLATPGELSAAARNTLNAHYTDAALVQAIWTGVQQLGFAGGRVLEAGCGSGNFIGFAPGGARVTGVELDPVTASIAASAVPGCRHRQRVLRRHPRPRRQLRPGDRQRPVRQFRPDRRAAQPRRAQHPQPLHHQEPAPGPAGRPGRRGDQPLHDGRPQPRRAPRDRRPGRPGRRGPAAQRRAPAGSRDQGHHRPADLPPPRARPRPGRHRLGADPDRRARRRPGPGQRVLPRQPRCRARRDARHPRRLQRRGPGRRRVRGHHRGPGPRPGPHRRGRPGPRPGLDRRTGPGPRRRQTGPRSRHPDGYLEAHRDGTFTQVAQGHAVPFPVPGTQAGELRHLLRLRDAVTGLLDAEAASRDDTPELDALRRDLNRRYDDYVRAYGPVNRFSWRPTGRPDPDTGGEKLARIRPPQGGFRSDPFAPLVQALEEFDPVSQTAAKAAIFTSRVVAPRNPRLGADNGADALAICLDVLGEVRLDAIARLLGTGEDQARRELGTLAFDDPGTGRLIPAAEYLSGKVRDKLEAAERAAADDPRYDVNAEELRKVIPADLMPSEIDARLGASWIDAVLRPGLPRRDPRRPRRAGRASRRAGLDRPRQPGHGAGHLHLGHQPLPRPGPGPGDPGAAPHRGPRQAGGRVLGPEHGRHPRRPGKSRRAGRAVPRLGLGRPGPRRGSWPPSTTGCSTTSSCAPTTTRRCRCPAWR